MLSSIWEHEVNFILNRAKSSAAGRSLRRDERLTLITPFPSPEDWRDQWIYFLMVDRFNNPAAPPLHSPFDDPQFDQFQGGTFGGVRERLPYLKELGAGAIWLSPVLKNCPYSPGSYHGYGIHDFLRAEPRFAADPQNADQELRDLVDAAHAQGIYVIFDIVLNHTGDVFAYDCRPGDASCRSSQGSVASFSDTAQPVHWRGQDGTPRADWSAAEDISNPPPDATVWPAELRRNEFFRRQGMPGEAETVGDFFSLKQMLTSDSGLQDVLIRAYQYVIAKYDADGFRIDTLKFIDRDFARTFGNAIREFALSIGKKNFFTFGEVFDAENKIAAFIGRNSADPGDFVGVDAALDFPLVFTLPGVVKGLAPPTAVVGMYENRKQIEHDILSSHGDATRFFVTFLDNHDLKQRFYYRPPDDPHRYDDQVTLGLACLLSLQGIPCVYYGTEQGLHGVGSDPAVREALWGKPGGFDTGVAFYRDLQGIAAVRASQPALRYGRQYFRPISGDGRTFGFSTFSPGVLAFSRILNDQEVVVVANANINQGQTVFVLVDFHLNAPGAAYQVLYSNKPEPTAPGGVEERTVTIVDINSATTVGLARIMQVSLQALEVQILGK